MKIISLMCVDNGFLCLMVCCVAFMSLQVASNTAVKKPGLTDRPVGTSRHCSMYVGG